MERTHQDIEIDLSNLPKDIWREIVKHGVNKNAQTEKEIFQMMDSLRATSKTTKAAVDNLVKTRGFKKNNPNYSYVDLKNDAMQDILIERAKKVVPLRTLGDLAKPNRDNFKKYKDEILNQAIKAEAINWSRYRLTIDPNFQQKLDQKLLDTTDEKDFETLLKMGANPNSRYQEDMPILFMILSKSERSPLLVELLLKYGANKNVLIYDKNIIRWIISEVLEIKHPVENIKILLKHGIKVTPYDLNYARNELAYLIRRHNAAPKNSPEKIELDKNLKQVLSIIFTLENHLKNTDAY